MVAKRIEHAGMRWMILGVVAVSFCCSGCLVRQQVKREGMVISDGYAFVTPFSKSKTKKRSTAPLYRGRQPVPAP